MIRTKKRMGLRGRDHPDHDSGPGGFSVIDAWIDTCGVAAGIGLLFWGHHWIRRKTERRKKHLEETI